MSEQLKKLREDEAFQSSDEFSSTQEKKTSDWSVFELISFRIAFVFFIIFCIPTDADWYKTLFSIDLFNLHYRDFYDVARFNPNFARELFDLKIDRWGFGAYIDWLIILGFSLVAGLIWTVIDSKRKEYNLLNYWLRVIVRYRAAIGIIAFGYTKLFPVQMPYPSESLLNNNFGDLTGHKVFWLSIGMVPWFQVFTGIVEVGAGILLFFRSTTFYDALLLVGTLLTITVVNLAYDGGVHVYAGYFVVLGLFLMSFDAKNIYRLFIEQKFTIPVRFYPDLSKGWLKFSRIGIKSLTIFSFVFLLFYYQWINFEYDPYKQPSVSGVKALRGYYQVVDFKLNGVSIPYSPLDQDRWQEVTFEKWTTLTFRVNKPVSLDLSNGGGGPMRDIERSFEVSGVAGGRRVFHYLADTVQQVLYLRDKNEASIKGARAAFEENGDAGKKENSQLKASYESWISKDAWKNIKDERTAIHPKAYSNRRDQAFATEGKEDYLRPRMMLHYQYSNNGKNVTLWGINEYGDSIRVVLEREIRDYALSESKVEAGKYD